MEASRKIYCSSLCLAACLILGPSLGCGPLPEPGNAAHAPVESWEQLLRGSSQTCVHGDECVSSVCVHGTCAGMLTHDDEWVHQVIVEKTAAILVKEQLGGEALVKELLQLALGKGINERTRCRAVRYLAGLPLPLRESALEEVMAKIPALRPPDCVRFWAAVGSAGFARAQAIGILEGYLASPSETIRLRVIETLSPKVSLHEKKLLMMMACGDYSPRVKDAATLVLDGGGVALECSPAI